MIRARNPARRIAMFNAGARLADIAAAEGVTDCALSAWFTRRGMRRAPTAHGNPRDLERELRVALLLHDGKSRRETARIVGCSPAQVDRIRKYRERDAHP